MQALGKRRARVGRAWAAQGRAGSGRWARAGRHGRSAWAPGMARRQACVGARAGADRRQQRACAAGAWTCAAGGAPANWACAAGGAQALGVSGRRGVGARGAGRGREGRAA